jgi:hypothetical protein
MRYRSGGERTQSDENARTDCIIELRVLRPETIGVVRSETYANFFVTMQG